MSGRTRPLISCENMNHRRKNAPVGFCSQCGGRVNDDVPTVQCTQDTHAAARRRQNTFCSGCGMELIVLR